MSNIKYARAAVCNLFPTQPLRALVQRLMRFTGNTLLVRMQLQTTSDAVCQYVKHIAQCFYKLWVEVCAVSTKAGGAVNSEVEALFVCHSRVYCMP